MGKEQLPGFDGCFVCDPSGLNPRSLALRFAWDDEQERIETSFTPAKDWCGFGGVVHGGILTAIADDSMAWAAHQATGKWGVTANLTIRFLRPVYEGEEYTAYGRTVEVNGKKVKTGARIVDKSGKTCADIKALFVVMPDRSDV